MDSCQQIPPPLIKHISQAARHLKIILRFNNLLLSKISLMYSDQQFAVFIAVNHCNENGFNDPIWRKKEKILPSSFRILHHNQTHTSSEYI